MGQSQELIISIHIYSKYKYTYENAGFCILCLDDLKILKISIFHRETSQAPTHPPPPPQRPYDVSRGQNRYYHEK